MHLYSAFLLIDETTQTQGTTMDEIDYEGLLRRIEQLGSRATQARR